MKRYRQITDMVDHVAIFSPEQNPYVKIMVKLNVMNPKPGAKDVYYITAREDEFDDLEKIEPGMYITVLHHVDNVVEKGETIFIKASELFINREETEKHRNQFDFDEDDGDEGVIHKFLIATPHHVSG